MADENLSFAIVFEEANRLVNGVREASQALEGIKSAANTAASGLDDAARSAITGAEAFEGIGRAADSAKAALADVSGAVDLQVDPGPLLETAAAAQNAGAEIQAFSSVVEEAKSESELAADAMSALGFATAEEEEAARLARDALDALAGVTGEVGDNSTQATRGIANLTSVFGNLGTVAKAAVAGFAGLAALRGAEEIGRAISGSMRTAVQEFLEAEKAATALDAALQSTGKFSSQATSAIRQFADEIARTTTFTDDAVVSAAALIAQVGQLGGPKLIQATQAAVELSSVLGRDLQQSALLLARGAAGATEAFSRFGIVVKTTGTDAEKFDQILGQISAKFAGRAAADARTFGGAIEQLKNSWKEFLETVGGTIVVFEPVLRTLTAALQKANQLLGIETVKSSLDARAALKEVSKAFDDVVQSQRELSPVSLKAISEGGDVKEAFEQQMKSAVAAAERVAAQAHIAIKASVEGGDLDEIADVETDIARLARLAQETSDANLRAIVQNLQFSLAAAKQAKAKIELEGGDKTLQGLEQIEELVKRLRGLSGAGGFEIINAQSAVKNADDFADAARQIELSTSAVIEAVDKIAQAGGKVTGAQLSEGFEALESARASIVEKFGKLAPEIDAAIKDAQDRLQDKARELNVRIELNLVGGFGQESIDALVKSFDQAEAEINTFSDFVRAANAAADADDLTLIETEKLLAQAKSLQDIAPIVEAAMQRLRQAIALGAVVGGPAANEGVAALFSAALQGSKALEDTFGSLSTEAQAAFGGIFAELQKLAITYQALQGPTQEFATQTSAVATGIATSFGQALGSLIGQANDFASVIRQIFAELVKEVLKQLAKIKAFSFLGGPIGGFIGGILGSILKGVQDAQIPPIQFPTPVIPPPTVPPPEVPKSLPPIVVPVEVLPATIPTPELPAIDPVEIPVSFGSIADIELPEVPSITVAVSVTDIESPALPDVSAIQIAVQLGEVPEIALPEVGSIQIPVELLGVGAPELPEAPELEIPVSLGAVPELDIPGADAIQVPVEVLTPEIEAIEVPALDLPEADPIQVSLEILTGAVEEPEVPEVAPLEIPVLFADVPELPQFDDVSITASFDLPEIAEVPISARFELPETPEIDFPGMTIPLDFTGPQIPSLPDIDFEAIEIQSEIIPPSIPEIELPDLRINLDFATPSIPDLPQFEPQQIDLAFAKPELPEIESVPASLEFARRLQLPDTVPASLEFARLLQDRSAARETRIRRDPLRIIEGQQAQPATNITINATDGISVRRQLTAGALRREVERNLRRGF